jgi:hypothetical protein
VCISLTEIFQIIHRLIVVFYETSIRICRGKLINLSLRSTLDLKSKTIFYQIV